MRGAVMRPKKDWGASGAVWGGPSDRVPDRLPSIGAAASAHQRPMIADAQGMMGGDNRGRLLHPIKDAGWGNRLQAPMDYLATEAGQAGGWKSAQHPSPRGQVQDPGLAAHQARAAAAVAAERIAAAAKNHIGYFEGVLRGGVVRRKPQFLGPVGKKDARPPKPNKKSYKPLNMGVTGSMQGGALIGQNKINVELQSAVDSNNATVGGGSGGGMKQYDLVKELGSGTSGVVHLVKRKADGTSWVVKQVRLGQGKGGGVSSERHARAARMERECVMQEVRIMQAMDSPYVVSFEASFADEKSVFIIMGYAERGCVADHARQALKAKHKFAEDEIWRCLIHVGCGLAHIHYHSVIHRDIKPHNILVDSDGTFLIADFGVAIETGTHISGRVRTGKGGTLQCMAPEICEDRPYSAKCDVWSLGCTIYEMLTLGPAFPANTGRIDTDLREVLQQHKLLPSRLSSVPSCYSSRLCDALSTCLTLDAGERPSAKALLCLPAVAEQADRAGIVLPDSGEPPGGKRRKGVKVPTPPAGTKGGGRDLQPWYLGM